ncbi:MAG: NAD-binding protein [Myxococcales bacterium]|nr:NAD-binding protein [Myxococcales bacterium]
MTTAREHIVVCGLGHVGYRVSRLLLRLGAPVAALGLEIRSDRARAVAEGGGDVLQGDARDDAELGRAGVEKASALVAVTDSDLANLEVALDARRASPELRLALRVFDRDLARTLEQSFGRARAVGVSALSAPVVAFGALGHEVTAGFSLGETDVLVGRLCLAEGSPLEGLDASDLRERFGVAVISGGPGKLGPGQSRTVVAERAAYLRLPGGQDALVTPPRAGAEPGVRKSLATAWSNSPRPLRRAFGLLLALTAVSVAVFRLGVDPPISLVEALYFTATTVTTTGYGDITPRTSGSLMMIYGSLFMVLGSVTMAVLYSFATSFVVSEQLRKELGRPPIPKGGHVIVVGLGNVGYRTVDTLRAADREVVAVDLNPDGEFATALRENRPFVAGDARLAATLESAGIGSAAAIIAATGDDAANLAITLTARRLSPKIRTVARVFDADFAAKLEAGRLVDLAVSTSRLAAPTFAAAALFDDAAVGFVEDAGLTALCFGAPPSDWRGRPPAELGEELPLVETDGALVAWDPREALPEACRVLWVRRRRWQS